MDVSKNSGTPKSSILIGFSIINHPFWGTPIFGTTYIVLVHDWGVMLCFSCIHGAVLCSCAHHKSCLAGPQPLKMSQQHTTDHIQEFMQIRDLQQNTKLPKTSTCYFGDKLLHFISAKHRLTKIISGHPAQLVEFGPPNLHTLRFLQLGTHLAAPWMLQLGLSLGPPCLDFGKSCGRKAFHRYMYL